MSFTTVHHVVWVTVKYIHLEMMLRGLGTEKRKQKSHVRCRSSRSRSSNVLRP